MRARNIKPSFFKSDSLSELDPLARILFVGLWCYADRDGLFEWRPKKIKIEILPYDDCDITCLLMSLHDNEFIYRYSVGGREYGCVNKFKKHQNPHPHEAKSVLPKPELNQCHDKQPTCNEMSENSRADLIIPDSLIPKEKPLSEKPDDEESTDPFKTFWNAYPKKTGKGTAEKAWKKIKRPKETVNLILEALEWQRKTEKWIKANGQFIPNPSTYLNSRGWEDEIPEPRNLEQEKSPEKIEEEKRLNASIKLTLQQQGAL